MKIFIFIIIICVICVSCLPAGTAFSFAQHSTINPEEIIVELKYRENVNDFISAQERLHPEWNVKVKRMLSKRLNIWLIGYENKSLSFQTFLNEIVKNPSVAIAQPNHTGIRLRSNTPNDSLFSNQWDMLNDGINGTVAGADISATEAWDISTGGVTANGDTIVVAVIDGGFALNHEDLNFFKNYNDTPGNNFDDDGNGYIDDVMGWNAIDNNGNVLYSGFWDQHASHVSGTVGARGNNGKGVTGVNWNVKVLPVSGSSSNESEVVAAYGYVLEMRFLYDSTNGAKGAYVVSTNSSFGVDFGQPADYPIWCAMYDSMGVYGIVSAGATINNNTDVDAQGDIPTACPSNYLIAVTNTNSSDQKVTQAGYGPVNIDIGAPGDDIWSTIPPSSYEGNNWSGTSMATPHIAGAVGLMYAAACKPILDSFINNPAGLASFMRSNLLNQGIDTLLSLQGLTTNAGRLNLHKCLLAVQSCSACSPNTIMTITDSVTPTNSNNGSITLTVNGGSAPYSYSWFPTNAGTGSAATGLSAGTYYVTVTDSSGCTQAGSYSVLLSGISELSFSGMITINPNPFTNKTILSIRGIAPRMIILKIFDPIGREIMSQIFNSEQAEISRGTLSPGIYFCKIISDDEIIAIEKLVVQK